MAGVIITTSLLFTLQHQSRQRDCLCHYGVETDVASVKTEELLGGVLKKKITLECIIYIHTYI